MMRLSDRVAATDGVVKRFRGKAFDWRKAATCIHLARAQAVAMGHKPPPVKRFQSALGARRALRELGFESVLELMDAMLPDRRIPPAAMLVGDLALIQGEQGLDAIVIAAGGSKVFGWHGADLSRLHPIEVNKADIYAAWRLGA